MEALYPSEEEVKEWMKTLPDYPLYKLNDILVPDNDFQQTLDYSKKINKKSKVSSYPSAIIDDWLYLGSHDDCKSVQVLSDLNITHILCCSDIIPLYFISDNNKYLKNTKIKYARIPIGDWYKSNIFNYFDAAIEFIHQCNPLNNNNNNGNNKILIHCQMGKSRSSTIVIAYLLSTKVQLNELQQSRFDYIRNKLNKFNNNYENDSNNNNRNDKNGTLGMRLNEALYYVKCCRSLIEPNKGFMLQLEKWEQICYAVNENNKNNDDSNGSGDNDDASNTSRILTISTFSTLKDAPNYTNNREIINVSKEASKLKYNEKTNEIEMQQSCSCGCVLL